MSANYKIEPAMKLSAVSPHASNFIPATKALYVGGAGDLVLIAEGDSAAVTLSGVAAGSIIPVRAIAVRNTSTATAIVALY